MKNSIQTIHISDETEVYLYFSKVVAERVISRLRLYGCAGQKLGKQFTRIILDSSIPSFF